MIPPNKKNRALRGEAEPRPAVDFWQHAFAVCLGGFLGLSLLKFGNPIILDRLVERPTNPWVFLFQPWPVVWGYWLLAGLVLLSLTTVRFSRAVPRWIILLPLIWFAWQILASVKTIEPHLTRATVIHFATCLIFFYLGLFGMSRVRRPGLLWVGLTIGFAVVVWTGFEQHYGGLEATRQFIYSQPDWRSYPPEYLRKIASNRIFSTLVYPNALAGSVILLLPALLWAAWNLTTSWRQILRLSLVAFLAYGGLACLFWSGSKAGWLIALAMGMVAFAYLPMQRKIKVAVVVGICALGLTGFLIRFAPYFKKGATSVGARFEYWKAAFAIAKTNPVFGTGPGTFSVSFRKIKPPEAEMARLVHNDYLEQASDSGVVGFLAYVAFMFGTLSFTFRRMNWDETGLSFAVSLGLFGWLLQGFVEFSLYIPAMAWCGFMLFGWMTGRLAEMKSTGLGALDTVSPANEDSLSERAQP